MTQWMITGVGHEDGRPTLELRSLSDDTDKRIQRVGDRLDLLICGTRHCIGYRAPGAETLEPCKQGNETGRSNQCSTCAELAQMRACHRCNGLRCSNPARRDSCVVAGNHAAYLAAFAPGVFKVGVGRWNRRRIRVIEQGARAAIVIARDDGQQIRRLESAIAQRGIPDRLAPGDRLRALAVDGDVASLQDDLEQIAAGFRRRLPWAQWLRPTETLDLPPVPVFPAGSRLLRPAPGEPLVGEISAVAGQFLVLERSDAPIALELSALVGYPVREVGRGERHDPHLGEYQTALAV